MCCTKHESYRMLNDTKYKPFLLQTVPVAAEAAAPRSSAATAMTTAASRVGRREAAAAATMIPAILAPPPRATTTRTWSCSRRSGRWKGRWRKTWTTSSKVRQDIVEVELSKDVFFAFCSRSLPGSAPSAAGMERKGRKVCLDALILCSLKWLNTMSLFFYFPKALFDELRARPPPSALPLRPSREEQGRRRATVQRGRPPAGILRRGQL